ncbi:MAG: hypothetical protein K8T25_08085 [Planctomycetia bacterium]|nr:hypothetical protein [Planctomycetia bacterium]
MYSSRSQDRIEKQAWGVAPATRGLFLISAILFGAASSVFAGESEVPTRPVREVFVPYADLEPLLRNQPRRMMLSRKEYDDLLAKAHESPAAGPAAKVVLSSADYSGNVEAGQARFLATMTVTVLDDDLLAVALPFSGVGILRADLDGSPAPLGQGPDGKLRLFVQGRGVRKLTAELMVPLSTTAARQSLSFQLPMPPGTRLRLSVPGDVELKSGAAIASREFDEKAGVTRFELLPQPGPVELQMSLNSRLLKRDRVVAAHGVVFDEVTGAYERLHATFSFDVLHGSAISYRFQLPEGFEVTTVLGRDVASWGVVKEGGKEGDKAAGKSILEVHLRDATTESVALNIGAERTVKAPEQWTMPRIEPLDVVRRDLVAGVLLEDRFEMERMEAQGLIALDTQSLAGGLAASVLQAVPGAPRVRAVAAWYAPLADYQLTARFRRPAAEVSVVTSQLLTFSDRGEDARGEFALQPAVEKLFALDFKAPAGWTVDTVSAASGARLKFDVLAEAQGAQRIHVKLPRGVAPGEIFKVQFHATMVPAGWLDPWQKRDAECPVFAVVGAKNDRGILAVKADDDIIVDPGKTEGLSPLYGDDKTRFGLEKLDAQVALSYRQQPYSAAVSLRRPKSWVTARTYQFFKVQPEAIHAHYELQYFIAEARTSTLAFTLPESTPVAISIEGLDGVKYKEYRSEVKNGLRHWTVELAERRLGRVRLKVTLAQKLDDKKSIALKLPLAEAQGVAYQSGLVAVEGTPELDVSVAAGHPREVDVGELSAAEYTPGKQLLGAYAFVGNPPAVGLSITRIQDYAIPTSLVQKASLITAISAGGVSQTSAQFELKTKDNYLHIVLPDDSTLWSVMIDGQPGRPQKDADGVLVVLPPGKANEIRQLRIAYQTRVSPLALSGRLQLGAPQLRIRRSEDGAGLEVPMADVDWQLRLPDGYILVDSNGTVHTTQLTQDQPLKLLGAALYTAGGGLFENGLISSAVQWRRSATNYAPTAVPMAEPRTGYESQSSDGDDVISFTKQRDQLPATEAPAAAPIDLGIDFRAGTKPAAPTPPPAVPEPAKPQDREKLFRASTPSTTTGGDLPAYSLLPSRSTKNKSKGESGWESFSSLDISLNVDVDKSRGEQAEVASFHSLGEGVTSLDIQVVDSRRIGFAAWGIGLLVGLVGVALTRRPARTKLYYVLSVILLSILLPLVVSPTLILSKAFEAAFVAAGLLAFYYLGVGLVRSLLRLAVPTSAASQGAVKAVGVAAVLLACCLSHVATTHAADPSLPRANPITPPPSDRSPLRLPDDAILIPYDPNQIGGIEAATSRADRLLVPLDRYIELWNQVHPNEKLQVNNKPAEYALSGGVFTATLSDGDTLTLTGHIDVDLFVDRAVEIPLGLSEVVLSRAEVEGKPARLRIATPASPAAAIPAGSGAVLHLEGQGRKRLMLELQLPISKSGGWRSVRGKIPAAPATVLTLNVPKRGTEVCTSCGPIVAQRETSRDNELRDVPLAADGMVDLRWRGHVDDAAADPTLTVESDVLADLREDAWRITWRANLRFARQQRESFQLSVPGDYLVERVLGSNVRGWEVARIDGRQRIDVGLLAPVTGQESLTIIMARTPATAKAPLPRAPAGKPATALFEMPKVEISGANLYRGTLTIRRSVRLDVQVAALVGLQQVGLPADLGQLTAGLPDSTLELKSLAAYRFGDASFSAQLDVRPVADDLSCAAQTLVRIESPDVELASRLIFTSPERPVYQIRVALPKGLALSQATSAADMLYSVATIDGREVLSVNFSTGQVGTFSINVAGRMKDLVAEGRTPLPQLQPLDVRQQQGEIVVQPPAGFDVRAQDLAGCSQLLLSEVSSWVDPAQQALAGLALRYRSAEYGGQLVLSARSPHIQAVTVTNVRYTPSTIEQTVHLQFDIKDAGIRQLSFLLPEALRQARLASNRALRQKSIEVAADHPGWVRVRLEFQELQMGVVNVEATHDQLLTQAALPAPIPVVETGKTNYRYVAMENSSRDEVVVAQQKNVEPLSRRQSAKQTLDNILGASSGEAFVVQEGAGEPLLELKTTPRVAEQTARARIRLAETVMTVDANGAYRAEQVFFVDNQTEQVLSIELPAGARLWTVRVAGQLVKPVRDTTAGGSQVRIPLVRTLEGDRDYQVEIKYGGQLPSFAPGRTVSFPVAKTVNIPVEQSHVQLRLPETHDWFDFGGTATKVENSAALDVGRQTYRQDELRRVIAANQQDDLFAQTRGRESLKSIEADIQQQISGADKYSGANAYIGRATTSAGELQQQAAQINKELQTLNLRQQDKDRSAIFRDNRRALTTNLNNSTVNPAAADLPTLAGNWKSASPSGTLTFGNDSGIGGETGIANGTGNGSGNGFNGAWYDRNGLKREEKERAGKDGDKLQDLTEAQAPGGETNEPRISLNNRQGQFEGKPQASQPGMGTQGGMGMGMGMGQGPPLAGQPAPATTQPAPPQQPQAIADGYFQSQLSQSPAAKNAGQDPAIQNPAPQEESKQLAQEYGKRLKEQNKQEGERGPDDKSKADHKPTEGSGKLPLAAGYNRQTVTKQSETDKGTYSLDVALPERGRVFYFTAVRGEPEITARAVPNWLVQRLVALLWIAGALAIGLVAYRGFRRAALGGASLGTMATLLIIVGILSIFLGILPVYGLVALVVGIVAAIRSRRRRAIAAT